MKSKTIGEIVTMDGRTATVFNKFGLDFCCSGDVTIESACLDKGLDVQEVLVDIQSLMNNGVKQDNLFNEMSLDRLSQYICVHLHQYIRDTAPAIAKFTDKVAKVHGKNHPNTIEIASLFDDLRFELEQHMLKEERILFPYITSIVQEGRCSGPFAEGPISVMLLEHDTAGDALRKLRNLSDDYNLPPDACNTFRAAYTNLESFEEDLHMHIHLENNILFPKAIELEKNLLRKA